MFKKIASLLVILPVMFGLNTMAKAEDLKITVLQEGSGAEATIFSEVFVHYTGWLLDGTKFDSSVDRGTPFNFTLGAGQVIKGWDQGVEGMKIGEKRELIIPAHLGYGDRGAGAAIPPGATLKFEVELLDVKEGPFKQITSAEFKDVLTADALAIDIRRADEWVKTGVIANVEKMTAFGPDLRFRSEFVGDINSYGVRSEPLYVIGSTEDDRALYLARALSEQAGFEKVFLVGDGIEGWIASGLPVEAYTE